MLTVLYISHESTTVFGSSRSLLNMIHSLEKEVRPVVVVPSAGAAYDYFKDNGIDVFVVPFPLDITSAHGLKRIFTFSIRFIRDLLFYSKGIRIITSIAKRYGVDIIHSNSSTVDIGHYVATKLKKPHVWHIREFQDKDFRLQPFLGWGYLKGLMRKASATISITRAIQEHFGLDKLANSHQIYNAVRAEADTCYIENKEKYFLMCGNLGRAKGCDTAIRAFAKFYTSHTDYCLKLVGRISSEYKEILINLATSLGVDSKIYFDGYQADTKSYFSKASAFLMCSPNEAMGRVTVEAMFYGCPVIGFNSGGTKEIVDNNVDGFLFDTIDECASLMERALQKETVYPIICHAQKKAIRQFSEELYGKKILSIYQELLK